MKIVIEDRREAHAERVNNNRHIVELVIGDIVMVRTAIQSDASTNKVAKLSYQVRGSFRIVQFTGRGSYLVRNLYRSNSPELKFMATDLYPLPHSLKPCEPIDSSDIRYLNQSYSHIINPLSKPLKIELYNKIWFDKPPRTSQPLSDYNHPTLAFPEPQLTLFTSLSNFYAETENIYPSPLIEKYGTDIFSSSSPFVLSKPLSISNSIFFIRYISEDTFKQR